jgi:hypothetical protein
MHEKEKIFLVIGLSIGVVIGLILRSAIIDRECQQQAIEKGFAEYDSKTGTWKWKVKDE